MQLGNETARQLYERIKGGKSALGYFGMGQRPAMVNVDLQKAYTCPAEFRTGYDGDPRQFEYINKIAQKLRDLQLPVIWTTVSYMESGEDCGVWGSRNSGPDALKNIRAGSRRAEFDDRLSIQPSDVLVTKRMASAFFETNLWSLLTYHRVDTVIVTGGSTSGCVRATAVDSVSRGFRTVVPEECVADKHESPHFASLFDLAAKYADVRSAQDVLEYLSGLPRARQ